MTPGQCLRIGRERQNKSRKQVAAEVHRSVSTVKAWELDQTRPRSFMDIRNICKACGVSIEAFITAGEERSQRANSAEEVRLLKAFGQLNKSNQKVLLHFIEELEV